MKTFDTDAHFENALINIGYKSVEKRYSLTTFQDLVIAYLSEILLEFVTRPSPEELSNAKTMARIFMKKEKNIKIIEKDLLNFEPTRIKLLEKELELEELRRSLDRLQAYKESQDYLDMVDFIKNLRGEVSGSFKEKIDLMQEKMCLDLNIFEIKNQIKNYLEIIASYGFSDVEILEQISCKKLITMFKIQVSGVDVRTIEQNKILSYYNLLLKLKSMIYAKYKDNPQDQKELEEYNSAVRIYEQIQSSPTSGLSAKSQKRRMNNLR